MRFFSAALPWLAPFARLIAATTPEQWPLHTDGATDLVEWDHYSFIVNGQRLFVWSGEMHYWRIPVPELWEDILQKIKAAGFNTISTYGHWGWHAASDGTLDFETGAHNIQSLFDLCSRIGLYIGFRPGPYINAETSAGGFPGWVTTGAYGTLRNNDTRYTAAWTPYMDKMATLIQANSITNGGPVITFQVENEYGDQWTDAGARTPNETAIAYMELLEAAVNKSGLLIPTTHNNPNLGSLSWSMDYDINHVGGDVWLYGLDSYPACWTCDLSVCESYGDSTDFATVDYYSNFQEAAPTMPSFLTEFQGGAYNPWNGPAGGCIDDTGVDWVNVFYRHNVAQKVTAQNIYMVFGASSHPSQTANRILTMSQGTNWGGLAFPTVGTSYDYSAAIQEDRQLNTKYSETKLLSLFIRAAKDLTQVERGSNGTDLTTNPLVFTQVLYNVENNAQFYVTVQANASLETSVSFQSYMNTSVGTLTVPQYAPDIVLNGRASKILLSDFNAGSQKIIYSTAEILTVSIQDDQPILVFWVPTGESGEFYLQGSTSGSVAKCNGCSNVDFYDAAEGIITTFTQDEGETIIEYDNGVKALILDRTTAYTLWQPTLSTDPHVPLNETLLVLGPYLVRNATISGSTVTLAGDYNDTTTLEVFAPTDVTTVMFNGVEIPTQPSGYGSLIGTLDDVVATIASVQASIPVLSDWRVADGLPERLAAYNDSGPAWVDANHTTNINPEGPAATLPILYADEYGFHTGNLLWRGRFTGAAATAVYLDVIGGTGSGWSAYLNGVFLGSTYGDVDLTQTALTLPFGAAVQPGENVLFVIQDHMGKDETTAALDPRGILNATLLPAGPRFASWKLAGNAGGERNIDPVRGPYAEGGLHGERLGWHLPGFDDGGWDAGAPGDGFGGAGARWYRTTFELDAPGGYDVALAFVLDAGGGNATVRAQLYVNGYQFAKFVPWIGNQVEFPVFPGVLEYHGVNTVALSVWAQGEEGAAVGVEVSVLGVYRSGFDVGFDAGYLRPGWTSERLMWY